MSLCTQWELPSAIPYIYIYIYIYTCCCNIISYNSSVVCPSDENSNPLRSIYEKNFVPLLIGYDFMDVILVYVVDVLGLRTEEMKKVTWCFTCLSLSGVRFVEST